MPDGYVVSVGVKADFSQLKSEQKEAVSSMQDFAARGAAALEAFQAAAKESGAAATFLNAQLKDLASANVAVVPAMEQAVAALRQSQAAKAADAAASKGAASSTREMSGQANVASMEMRVLGGSTLGAARAAGVFAAQSLGLGPILAAAFPLIGAAAMVMMIGTLISGVVKFADDAEALGAELGGGWLDGAIAEMSGLGKAIKQSDDELLRLASDRDRMREESDRADVEHARLTGGNAAGDNLEASQLQKRIDALEQAKRLQIEQSEALDRQINSQYELDQVGSLGIAKLRKEQEVANAQYKDALEQQLVLIKQKDDLYLKAQQSEEKANNKKTPHESSQSYADVAAQKKEEGASLGDLVLYWEQVVATTGKYHEQLLHAEQEFQKQLNAPGKLKASLAKEQVGPEPAALPPDFMQHKQTEAEADERINKALAEQQKHSEHIYEMTMKIAEFKQRMGQMSPARAAQMESGASRTEQDTDVSALQAQQKAIAPMGPVGLDGKMLAEWQKLQEQITAAQEKGSQQREQIAQKEALTQQQQYQKMFSAMTGPMNEFTDHWLQNGMYMSVAFQRMYDQMAMSVINAEIRMLEKHLEAELQKEFATLASNTAQTTSTVSANAVKTASDTTTATMSISKKAADAAAGAWNALSNIPVVGPVLGAAAAAAVWTGVMALAAFENGADYIPRTGVAMLHQGEAVATAGENSRISQVISMAQNGGGAPGGVHFHDHSNFTGIDGASVAGMARQHGAQFRRETMRQLRIANKI
jgi:hypothetical protein